MNSTRNLDDIPLGGEQATVTRWLVEPGVAVVMGQPLVVLLGERAEFALAAEHAGTIANLVVAEGATVHLGELLATLADAAPALAPIRATPLARRIARDHGVNLDGFTGSGFGGRILKRDVLARVDDRRPTTDDRRPTTDDQTMAALERSNAPTFQRSSVPTLKRSNAQAFQRSNAQTLERSNAPFVVAVMEADFGAVWEACAKLRASGRIAVDERACVALVVAEALREHPFQARWSEEGIVRRRRIMLAIEQAGLQATIADAQDLNLRGIARALANASIQSDITFRIRFTGTSGWAQATTAPTLVVGAAEKRAVVCGAAPNELIAIRPMVWLTLQYDARVATQREADSFLQTVAQAIEQFNVR